MSKILAYLRTSTDKQDLDHQRLEILEYARQNHLHIDDFIHISRSSRDSQRARRIEELVDELHEGDTLIVTELSRLGRSTGQVISLMDALISDGVTVIVIQQRLVFNQHQDDIQSITMLTLLSLFAQLERSMISRRTREALATKKAQGVRLGKPRGTLQQSQFDGDRDRIVTLLSMGLSVRKISVEHLQYGDPSSLHYYVRTRNLRHEAKQLQKK